MQLAYLAYKVLSQQVVVQRVFNGNKQNSLVVGNQIVYSGTFELLIIWQENMLHPFGMQHASCAVEAMGICRLLQTSSLQATDKNSRSILVMEILEVAVLLLLPCR